MSFSQCWIIKSLSCRLAAGDEILLNCDAGKMQRVFDNLLRNTVNYSCDGTEIIVVAEQSEDGVTLKFFNCSGTIPRENLEQIFEQFYRLDTGCSRGRAVSGYRKSGSSRSTRDDRGGERRQTDSFYSNTSCFLANTNTQKSRRNTY